MSNQRLRIYLAALIAVVSLVSVTLLQLAGVEVPKLYEFVVVGAVTYLFGVSTNGSGLGGNGKNGGPS